MQEKFNLDSSLKTTVGIEIEVENSINLFRKRQQNVNKCTHVTKDYNFLSEIRNLVLKKARKKWHVTVQGGIALTSPPCHKKQTSGLTKKSGLFIKRTAKWLS